jgi:Na+-transporting NADH:ubiquinone oxidoreductase subunit A
VKIGDEVKAGTTIFKDKDNEKILFASPTSGEIIEINRGEKRKILDIKILADKEVQYESFSKSNPNDLSKEEITELILQSGAWPMIKQRPFATIANPSDKPKAIFISAFDSSPLAPDYDFILHGHGKEFQSGIDALSKLTDGKVHLNVRANSTTSKVFTNSKNAQINTISGPHPAGNVGVQIHHIDPVNKGEVVWHISPQEVAILGRLFLEGRYNASKVIALTGSEVSKTRYYKTLSGSSIKHLVTGNVAEGTLRYITGNPLTGTKIPSDGYIGFYDNQVTVIPEGNEPEFLGWLAPGTHKFSMSKTFLSWLTPNKEYRLNTNLNGEGRAYVVTGEYEKVLPMDIYPVHLIKSIMIGDIEQMENLGIYEVAEEDFALCEYVCTSKTNVQDIIREGLDLVKAEC